MFSSSKIKWAFAVLAGFFILTCAGLYFFWPQPFLVLAQPGEVIEMPATSPFVFRFSEAMSKGQTQSAFLITPEIPGTFEWQDSKTLLFKPESVLMLGDTYKVTMASFAMDIFRRPLGHDTVLEFEVTGLPKVSYVFPEDGAVISHLQPVTVLFDRPMHPFLTLPQASEDHEILKTEPEVKGELKWISNRAFQFLPQSWPLKGEVKFTVLADLPAYSGGLTEVQTQMTYKIAPPKVTDFKKDQALEVRFNQPMVLDSVKPGLNVQLFPSNDADAEKNPKNDGFFNTEVTYGKKADGSLDDTLLVFDPTFPFLKNQPYEIKISGLQNKAGVSLADEFVTSFEVRSKLPRLASIETVETENFSQPDSEALEAPKVWILFDQSAALPGSTIRFKGLSFLGESIVHWKLVSPLGEALFEEETALKRDFSFEGTFILPEVLESAVYAFEIWNADQTVLLIQEPFTVMNEKPLSIGLAFDRIKTLYTPRDVLVASFNAHYSFGAPLAGAKAKVQLIAADDSIVLEQTGALDEKGQFEIAQRLDKIRPSQAPFVLYGEAETLYGETYSHAIAFPFRASRLNLELKMKNRLPTEKTELYFSLFAEGNAMELQLLKAEDGKVLLSQSYAGGSEILETDIPLDLRFIPGSYVARLEAEDVDGNVTQEDLPFVVLPSTPETFLGTPLFTITPDHTDYLVGGKARILLQGEAGEKVEVERGRGENAATQTVELLHGFSVLEIPIESHLLPWFFVKAKDKTVILPVNRREKILQIKAEDLGEKIQVTTTNYQNRPLSANVLALARVSEKGDSLPPLRSFLDAFYPLPGMFEEFHGQEALRNPVYFEILKTNDYGLLEFEVPLPKEEGQLSLQFYAYTGAGLLGSSSLEKVIPKSEDVVLPDDIQAPAPAFDSLFLLDPGLMEDDSVSQAVAELDDAEKNPEILMELLWKLTPMGELDTERTLKLYDLRSDLNLASRAKLLFVLTALEKAGQKSVYPFIERLKSELVTEGGESWATPKPKDPYWVALTPFYAPEQGETVDQTLTVIAGEESSFVKIAIPVRHDFRVLPVSPVQMESLGLPFSVQETENGDLLFSAENLAKGVYQIPLKFYIGEDTELTGDLSTQILKTLILH